MTTTKPTDSTPLADLGFAHLDTVLEEAFGIAPAAIFPDAPRPVTVGDLARISARPAAEIVKRLGEILALEADPEIDAETLKAKMDAGRSPILVDVREPWEFDICHLPGSILLATANFPEVLERLRTAPEVVTVCHHGVRSYSAALFLRQKGVKGAKSLAGGVEHWASVIDPGMARY